MNSDDDCKTVVAKMTSSEAEHIDCDLALSSVETSSPVKKRIK